MPWIRPQDQMPKEGEPVLITDVEGMQIVAWWDGSMWHSENYSWWPREVTYWMSIPEPPKPIEAMEKIKQSEQIGNPEQFNFTKGEWIAERKSEYQICHLIKTGDMHTIHVYDSKYGIDESESWNNAKLIALSPKMYELLNLLKERLNYFNDKVSVNQIDELMSGISVFPNTH